MSSRLADRFPSGRRPAAGYRSRDSDRTATGPGGSVCSESVGVGVDLEPGRHRAHGHFRARPGMAPRLPGSGHDGSAHRGSRRFRQITSRKRRLYGTLPDHTAIGRLV